MKILILSVFTAFLFAACTSSSNKEEQAAIEKEVAIHDSIALETEKVEIDLQESMSRVDSLLNEL
jgi:ABC-type Fe3+-hydroxamate transport system substrate-binding protein